MNIFRCFSKLLKHYIPHQIRKELLNELIIGTEIQHPYEVKKYKKPFFKINLTYGQSSFEINSNYQTNQVYLTYYKNEFYHYLYSICKILTLRIEIIYQIIVLIIASSLCLSCNEEIQYDQIYGYQLVYSTLLSIQIFTCLVREFFSNRHLKQNEKEINEQECSIFTLFDNKQQFLPRKEYQLLQQTKVKNLKPGMIVLLRNNQPAPADLLILDSADSECVVSQKLLGVFSFVNKSPCTITFIQPNLSMKNNILEYRKFLNLSVKYNDYDEGFLKLKNNPNIEYFHHNNIIFRQEVFISPNYLYGLVLKIGNNCKYYHNIQKDDFIRSGTINQQNNSIMILFIILNIIFSIVNILFYYFKGISIYNVANDKSISFVYVLFYQLVKFLYMIPFPLRILNDILQLYQVWKFNYSQPQIFQEQSGVVESLFESNNITENGFIKKGQNKDTSCQYNGQLDIYEMQQCRHILLHKSIFRESNKCILKAIYYQDELYKIEMSNLNNKLKEKLEEKKNEIDFNMHNYSHSQDEVSDLDEIVSRIQNYNISNCVKNKQRNRTRQNEETRTRKQFISSTFFKLIPIEDNSKNEKQSKKRLTFQQIVNPTENFTQNDFVEQLVLFPEKYDELLKSMLLCIHAKSSFSDMHSIQNSVFNEIDLMQIEFCQKLGYELTCVSQAQQNYYMITIKRFIIIQDPEHQLRTFGVVSVHFQTPKRPRTFSILIKEGDKFYLIYRKLTSKIPNSIKPQPQDQVDQFIAKGQFVIVYGQKDITLDEAIQFQKNMSNVFTENMEDLIINIENNLNLLAIISAQNEERQFTRQLIKNFRQADLSQWIVTNGDQSTLLPFLYQFEYIRPHTMLLIFDQNNLNQLKHYMKNVLRRLIQSFQPVKQPQSPMKKSISSHKSTARRNTQALLLENDVYLIINGLTLELIVSDIYFLNHMKFLIQYVKGISFNEINVQEKKSLEKFLKYTGRKFLTLDSFQGDFNTDYMFCQIGDQALAYPKAILTLNRFQNFIKIFYLHTRIIFELIKNFNTNQLQRIMYFAILQFVFQIIFENNYLIDQYERFINLFIIYLIVSFSSTLSLIINHYKYNKKIQVKYESLGSEITLFTNQFIANNKIDQYHLIIKIIINNLICSIIFFIFIKILFQVNLYENNLTPIIYFSISIQDKIDLGELVEGRSNQIIFSIFEIFSDYILISAIMPQFDRNLTSYDYFNSIKIVFWSQTIIPFFGFIFMNILFKTIIIPGQKNIYSTKLIDNEEDFYFIKCKIYFLIFRLEIEKNILTNKQKSYNLSENLRQIFGKSEIDPILKDGIKYILKTILSNIERFVRYEK